MENLTALTRHVRSELSKVLVGQREVADQLLLVLLCGGHAVIEGVPGLAKTLAVKSLARICGLGFQRVQCTADLMPADITGTSIFNLASSAFTLHRGPVFTDLLLVDEINRTAPRTQAALLEAMEERQVTIDGARYSLPENFTVLATQNPVEFEGTYPLPEAQLDRFLLKIRILYPTADEEIEIVSRHGAGFDARRLAIIVLAIVGISGALALRGQASVWLLAVIGVLFFLLFFGYFAIFEILWNGQTPGKRIIGIRVVKDSGRPLTAAESIGRNLLRIVDQLPGFYAIGITVAILNSSNKRLGDLVAGSLVVRESSLAAIKPAWQTMQAATGPLLGGNALSIEDLTLIDAFLNRRSELDPKVRSRMAWQILNQLSPKLPAPPVPGSSNESTLESLAWERRSRVE